MAESITAETICMNPDCGKQVPFEIDAADDELIVCPACQTPIGTVEVLREAAAADARNAKKRKAIKFAKKEMGFPRKLNIKIN